MNIEPFGIYLHVPYCRRICRYCGFVHVAIGSEAVPDPFVDALVQEILSFEGPDRGDTVFFGGGTPSLLTRPQLETILTALQRRFTLDEPEITLEANPDDVTQDLVQAWRDLGINRVSLGVQSFCDPCLRYLGRRHSADSARAAVAFVSRSFSNWSLDLIYGAAGMHSWRETLAEVIDYSPPHISTYALTQVPGTPIGDTSKRVCDDDTTLDLYMWAETYLKQQGYIHYEISNFARTGCECRHNLLYWRNQRYAGFGPGAWSLVGETRASNHSEPARYMFHPGEKAESYLLTAREQQVETLIQGMRLRDGIQCAAYERRFGQSIEASFGAVIASLSARGLVEWVDGCLRPTAAGFYLNDEIGLALVDEQVSAEPSQQQESRA